MIEPRALERIALTRLPELQVASGLFRATARIEGVEDETAPATTLQAGIVVLLGLLRAEEAETDQPFSTGALRTRILGDLSGPDVTAGELGLALWAESRCGGEAIGEIDGLIRRATVGGLEKVPTEQIAWLASGLAETAVLTGDPSTGLIREVKAELSARITPGGLARDVHARRLGVAVPVTGQFHLLHALVQLVRAGEEDCRNRADQLAGALLALQREDGAWPGLIDPVRSEAAVVYPVLAVTQIAAAPIALRAATELGLGDFEAAAKSGIQWANGGNALGLSLVHEADARIDRGILTKRKPGALERGISSAARRIRGQAFEPDAKQLIIDPAASSEDLGWVLEAWAGR
ncbi:MAG TPA: hypothetical protein PLB47_00095 [Solirubrobacterales bacterium]|jgi:hypothetical protein|nr:hypothetical protein [Solirubrobacterales bacterium]HNA22879.1 hypothetical protein [Solirubrobacterales bacterium]HNC04812.1 hypothetical protein [Solirubrobacterales bacterium]HNE77661.1 hypothetical protein [Solirubrobacterales bacterium]HNG57197.1 hypothetical protein [Solirubrobacterales bacterium]